MYSLSSGILKQKSLLPNLNYEHSQLSHFKGRINTPLRGRVNKSAK
jgi:hypothetical protein